MADTIIPPEESSPTTQIQRQVELIGRKFERIEEALHNGPKGLIDYLGLSPDKYIAKYFEHLPENDLYEAMYGTSAPLRHKPAYIGMKSTLCRQVHFSVDEFRFWVKAMGRKPRLHRKDWEWFYIAQSLFEAGMLQGGKRGLGFAVGREPLSALFASYGCDILATDQAQEQARQSGWAVSGQYSDHIESIFEPTVCERDVFFSHVDYKSMDMNAIPEDQNGLNDFCWSSCSFEHLGSLEHGMRFVERAMETLKPGGIAVHTTEFNLSSNDETVESEGLSIYRKRDIQQLASRLEVSGHQVEPFDWSVDQGFAESVVDLPPYRQSPHLRLKIDRFDCTSVGIIVRKSL